MSFEDDHEDNEQGSLKPHAALVGIRKVEYAFRGLNSDGP